MKKILYLAVVALLMIACTSEEPNVNSDKKVINSLSSSILNLIGEDSAKVEKEFGKWGFKKIENPYSSECSVVYVYDPINQSNPVFDLDELSMVYNVITKDRVYIYAAPIYIDNKLGIVYIYAYVPLVENVGAIYMSASENLYKAIQKIYEQTSWYGAINFEGSYYAQEGRSAEYETSQRAIFEATMAKYINTFSAFESSWPENGNGYASQWINPSEEERQEAFAEGSWPYVFWLLHCGYQTGR